MCRRFLIKLILKQYKFTIMQKIRFSSAQELVNWLMENEGQILSDSYGRKMYYENFKFYFMDISSNGHFIDGIYCLDLFGETWSYEE